MSEQKPDGAPGSTWGEELVYLRPVEATIAWRDWTLMLNDWGNIQERRITGGSTRLAEYDELVRLEKIAGQNPNEANLWPTVFTLSTASDMVRVDLDGTRYLETGGMSLNQKLYGEEAYDTYMRQAYAYSRGNLKIGLIRRDPVEPFTGEYTWPVFFFPGDHLDLGRDLEPMSFDSMNAIWFPGPVRPWSRGATTGGSNWGYFAGHTSTQFAPGREAGRRISDVAHITLHEWLHQIAGMRWHLGYFGLPGQYDPGNYNSGAHLYYQHYIITPRMWRVMHHRNPQQAAPNKPKLRHAGYLRDWIICGEFEGDDRESIARDPIHSAWASIQVQGRGLTPEELDFPESERTLMPIEGDELMDKTWVRHTPTRDLLDRSGAHDDELDFVFLRRDGNKGEFPVRRRNVYVYAASYVWSPETQDATIWAGCETPFKLYLNDEECFRCGRGTRQDDAVRDVRLRKGWNRVLVQTMDQAGRNWSFGVKFTDRDRNDLPGLKVSPVRPEELDPETMLLDLEDAGPCVPDIETPLTYYSWDGDVADDWWGALPVLNEQHFEAILGQRGVRIDGSRTLERPEDGPDHSRSDKVILVDVSAINGIQSRVTARPDPYDALLNNLINWSIETMALVRYTHPETGKPRDLLFVRIDMVEPYIEMIDVAGERSLRDSIIGVILRDTKQAVVFDTYLGEQLPANELSLLTVRDQDVTVRAWPSVPRVVRGQPLNLSLKAAYGPVQVGHAIPLENLELKLARRVQTPAADTVEYADEYTRSLMSILPGEALTIEAPIDTKTLPAGIVTYTGSVTYTRDGAQHTVSRPVPVNVFDPVSLTLNIDGSSLLTVPRATASVVVHNNLGTRANGTLRLELPDGWKASPTKHTFRLDTQDAEARLTFEITLPPDAPGTTYVLRAAAQVGAARAVTSTGEHQVQVALGGALIDEDFEHDIPADFGRTTGLYKVQLARQEFNAPVAHTGSTCLMVQDGGGGRYGHVYMFGADRFWPGGRRKPNTTYTFDTNDYPVIEWWMRSDARDANLGLNIQLETDRPQKWYGVLLHGLWEQQWNPSQRLDTIDFPTDQRWHKITVNLDELLDAYLGDEPHRVSEIRFGDTRIFASGWWSDARKYAHYIDEFTIRKARPDERHEPPTKVLRLEGADRPPAFEMPEPSGDLVLTIRPREVSYTQNTAVLLDGWISNLGMESVDVPRSPESGQFAIKLVDEQGNDVFGDRDGGWLDISPKEPTGALVTLNANESTRWSRDHGGAILLGEPAEKYLEGNAGTYLLSAKVQYREQIEVVSNAVPFVITPSPTKDELLAQLKSAYERERAQAVTALSGPVRFAIDRHAASKSAEELGGARTPLVIDSTQEIMHALVRMLDDADAGVRLNAAYALGRIAEESRGAVAGIEVTEDRDIGMFMPDVPFSPTDPRFWDPAMDALIAALDDENWRVGEYVGFALAKIGDPRGIEPLTKRLRNDSPWIRRRTAEALGEYWLHMPRDPDDADGRTAAVDAAALAFERLIDATDNEMPSTRLYAYQAARKFVGRPEGAAEREAIARDKFVPVIRKALGDVCWNVRVEAAGWAAEWLEQDLSTELTAMLSDPDWIAREHLAGKLADLANRRGDNAVNAARQDAEAKGEEFTDEQAAAITLEAKQPQIDMLKTLLEDDRIQVRWAAIRALHKLNTGQSIEELTGHPADHWRALTN